LQGKSSAVGPFALILQTLVPLLVVEAEEGDVEVVEGLVTEVVEALVTEEVEAVAVAVGVEEEVEAVVTLVQIHLKRRELLQVLLVIRSHLINLLFK
jgi:hypothetical protein